VAFRLLQLGEDNIAYPCVGPQMRNYHIARELARVMDVTHVGFSDKCEKVETSHHGQIRITLVPKEPAYTLAKLVRGAFGRTPVMLLNFRSRVMASVLSDELAMFRYDVIQIEGIEMSPYLRLILAAPNRPKHIVLDWHGIDSQMVRRQACNAATPLHRVYLRRAIGQLKKAETEAIDNCELHLVTSELERDELLARRPEAHIIVVENGVEVSHFTEPMVCRVGTDQWTARRRILFVGNMGYSANVDAVGYFVEQVWPRIHRDSPALVFTVVGRNPSGRIRALASRPGIEVTGTVEDVRPYYGEAVAAVVPLRLGGGTRLKILEAMAAGVPVVSTRLGAEGLRVEPETHFMLAQTAADFYAQVRRLCEDFGLWRRVSAAGRELVEGCLLYTSPSPRDLSTSRMPSSA